MSMHTTTSKIVINASPERVWAALTQPELVKQWQFGSEVSTDWQPGSPIRFKSEWDGTVYEQWGTIETVEPNKTLAYKLFAPRPDLEDKPENYFTMKYLLSEQDGNTELTIIQEDPRPQVGPAADDEEAGNTVLASLKKVVEGK